MNPTSNAQSLFTVATCSVLMLCLVLAAPVEAADWLITPEEAALDPARKQDGAFWRSDGTT